MVPIVYVSQMTTTLPLSTSLFTIRMIDSVFTFGPKAWTTKPIKQDVIYEDRPAVDRALAKLAKLPPLVTPTEVHLSLSPHVGDHESIHTKMW